MRQPNLQRIADLEVQVKELQALCVRAADALEEDHEVIKDFFSTSRVRDKHLPLIAELRKAAQ